MLSHIWLFVIPRTVARRLFCLWDSTGKTIGVRCHFLLQRIFLTHGLNPHLLHWQADSLPLCNLGSHTHIYYIHICIYMKWSEVAQSCPTVCNPVDCSLSGSSIHGILQARILEWVAISFSRGSSQPRDRIWVSCIAGRCFNLWATRDAPCIHTHTYKLVYFHLSTKASTNWETLQVFFFFF